MSEVDQYGDWDAAYVLGALTPQERRAYEDHLAGCPDCQQAVAELAAMPGLLAHLPAQEAMALIDDQRLTDDPNSGMPESIATMRPPRRQRRTMIIMVLGVALSLIIGGVIGFVIRSGMPDTPLPRDPNAVVRVAFEPVQGSRMVAVADLRPSGNTTRIDVDCLYSAKGAKPGAHEYLLYVVDQQGKRVESTTWAAEPGYGGQPKINSQLPLSDIAALEITLAKNDLLLMRAPIS